MTRPSATIVGWLLGFDAPQLLPWLLAAAIPLVLALWARGRLPRVAFGGFPLLREVAAKQSVRVVTRRRWETLLRVLVLVAIVLAAARPRLEPGDDGDERAGKAFADRVWLIAPGRPEALPERAVAADAAVAAALAVGPTKPAVERSADLTGPVAAAVPGDLLFLCDGLVPSPSETEAFCRRVESGVAAVVLLGPATLAEAGWPAWRDRLGSLTGLQIGDVAAAGTGEIAAAADLAAAGDLAAAENQADAAGLVGLPGPTVERYLQLRLRDPSRGQVALAATAVAATDGTAAPIAVATPVGRGAITVSAVPLTLGTAVAAGAGDEAASRWSDLPAWPVFLPYIRGLAAATCRRCEAFRGVRVTPAAGTWPGLALLAVALAGLAADARIDPGGSWGLAARLLAAGTVVGLAAALLRPLEAAGRDPAAVSPPAAAKPRLDAAAVPPLCWPGERVEILATVAGAVPAGARLVLEGPEGRLAEASLPGDAAGNGASGEPNRHRHRLVWEVPAAMAPGRCRLRVRLRAPAGRDAATATAWGNGLALTTMLADRPARLLLVDSAARFEYRFVLQAVAGDRRFSLTPRLLSTTSASAFDDWDAFDVVWLGDCVGILPGEPVADSAGLSAAVLAGIGRQLAAGRTAVAWQPGERFRQGGFVAGKAAAWLPVRASAPLPPPLRSGPGLPLVSQRAGIAAGWLPANRPSLGRAYSLLHPVVLEPTTVVLATAGAAPTGSAPAIVLGRVGKGVVVGSLCETWRWRSDWPADGSGLHAAFWRQTLCRLATPPLLRKLGAGDLAATWPAGTESASATRPGPPPVSESRPRLPGVHLLVAAIVGCCAAAWWPGRGESL